MTIALRQNMPRKPRYLQIGDNETFHLMWQCHNEDFLLDETFIKTEYLKLFKRYAPKFGIKIYAYSIMSSHPHFLGSYVHLKEFSKFQQIINSIIARKINFNYRRKGQVVCNRFKIVPVRKESQHLAVLQYIEMNAVEAGIVDHPKNYPWCTYHYYASGIPNDLLTHSPCYLKFADSPKERMRIYRELIDLRVEKYQIQKEIEGCVLD